MDPPPATEGYNCHLCEWGTRSVSRSLMDVKSLMAHGQRFHYLQERQLTEYVKNAKHEIRHPARLTPSTLGHTQSSDVPRRMDIHSLLNSHDSPLRKGFVGVVGADYLKPSVAPKLGILFHLDNPDPKDDSPGQEKIVGYTSSEHDRPIYDRHEGKDDGCISSGDHNQRVDKSAYQTRDRSISSNDDETVDDSPTPSRITIRNSAKPVPISNGVKMMHAVTARQPHGRVVPSSRKGPAKVNHQMPTASVANPINPAARLFPKFRDLSRAPRRSAPISSPGLSPGLYLQPTQTHNSGRSTSQVYFIRGVEAFQRKNGHRPSLRDMVNMVKPGQLRDQSTDKVPRIQAAEVIPAGVTMAHPNLLRGDLKALKSSTQAMENAGECLSSANSNPGRMDDDHLLDQFMKLSAALETNNPEGIDAENNPSIALDIERLLAPREFDFSVKHAIVQMQEDGWFSPKNPYTDELISSDHRLVKMSIRACNERSTQ